jgi:DNA ligase-1
MRSGRYGVLSESRVVPSRAGYLIPSDSVTVSPISVAAKGLVSEDKGLSLRFPRFVRVREDKSVEQASSTDFLAGMYREQQGRGEGDGGADDGHLIDPSLSDTASDDDWEDELDL